MPEPAAEPAAAAPGEEEPAPPVSAQVQAARALRAQRAAAAGPEPTEAAGAPNERELMAAMGLPTALGPAAAPTAAAAPADAAPAEAPGTQKTCKHCGQARSQSMFVEKQWKKPRPTCVDCAAKLSAQNATAEQPPPPPPARRWFSRADPEPSAPIFEEMYNQIAAWYNQPENAALHARWGPFPEPEEFQTWPGFVRVTNAFLDARSIEP